MTFDEIKVNGFYMTTKGHVRVKSKEHILSFIHATKAWCNVELHEAGAQFQVHPSNFKFETIRTQW